MKTRHLLLTAAVLLLPQLSPAATQTVIPAPPGSGLFGLNVTMLANGNFLVVDPSYSVPSPAVGAVGAVRLYSPQGALISTLVGSQATDQVGNNGITVLASGHFVVLSPAWRNGAAASAGAVTWGHAETGWGVGQVVAVSPANSLVGTSAGDQVGGYGVTPLPSGHYVVRSVTWTHGSAANAGAITWGNGQGGTTGPVSAANSLVGSQADDILGSIGITVLSNGNYVVASPEWDNGPVVNAGAVTWCSGLTSTSGEVTHLNSLIGSQADDQVGNGIHTLTNGNYVVASPGWDNGPVVNAGAATWCNGTTGAIGPVTPANSLVGSQTADAVSSHGVTPLTNGNYVVKSLVWDNGPVANAGAATWGNGRGVTAGPVSPANSLVGSQAEDGVGDTVTALTNGHYVVGSELWDDGGVANAGAATWGSGVTGITGPVSRANSLVGSRESDFVSTSGIIPLTNGHYVVASSLWDNGNRTNAGAATWGNGLGGTVGEIRPGNSLVGTRASDFVGSRVTALSNGNYFVAMQFWDNDAVSNAGAVTWGNGSTGTRGPVTPANSLVGSQTNDNVGLSTFPLSNGHYVVASAFWDNGGLAGTGAVTWCNGLGGTTGPVTPANSLVGGQPGDSVGGNGVTALPNGNYVVASQHWDNGTVAEAGALTFGNGLGGTVGLVTPVNSLVGTQEDDFVGGFGLVQALEDGNYVMRAINYDNGAAFQAGVVSLGDGQTGTAGQVSPENSVPGGVIGGGAQLRHAYDATRQRLVVGDPSSNQVTIFTPTRPYSLAKAGADAPGAVDIAFAAPGALAVDAGGGALFEAGLTGSGARTGKRGLFAPGFNGALDLVLRQGDAVAALGLDLPGDAVVASLGGPLRQQAGRGLFQATVKGTGVTAVNNRLLLLDDGIRVRPLLRSGQRITLLFGASVNRTLEVAQSHDQDAIAVTYVLNKGGSTAVTGANDTGLLLLRHDGSTQGIGTGREGAEAFGGGGTFGQFTGRVAAGQGDTVHFSALYQPTVGKAVPALFRTTLDGVTRSRTATVGDAAPGAGGATFASFKGLSQMGADALFTATLKGSPANANEGLWRDDGSPVLTRKGDEVAPGLTITRLLRFWPAGGTRVLLQAQLSNRTQALLLRQENGSYRRLMATGDTPPGVGAAKLKTINAVEADPVTGHYAVLGTLSGAPAAANQALWSGNAALGDESAAGSVYRLPVLRLRKGQTYRTESTPQSVLRGISLRPAVDTSGAGGRGLAQVVGSSGAIGLVLTGDRKLSEVVVLK